MNDIRLLVKVGLLLVNIHLGAGIMLELEVPSPLRAGREDTAVCTGKDVSGWGAPTWQLNSVEITEGFTTASSAIVQDISQTKFESKAATLICLGGTSTCDDYAVRLVGGSNEREGRVEILCDGQWGTVCDACWDINDANVVCRELGYSSASAHYRGAHFGQGSGPILLQEAGCDGTENSLLQCPRTYWGCDTTCDHSLDAGLRCEGDRTASAGAYNVRSDLTLIPTAADHGGVLQCSLQSSEQSSTLQVQYAPADNIIVIQISHVEDEEETNDLKITCHVNTCDQPVPPIEAYEIAIDDVIQSSSSSPTVTLDPLPSGCVEISCTGINEIGNTTTAQTYCTKSCETSGESPASDILSIKTSEFLNKDRQMNLLILCRANLSDQPFPYLHLYSIEVDGTILSNASWTSAVLRPRPNRCINVTCSATNGVGITSALTRHCPRDHAPPASNILSIETQEINGEGSEVILVITCHISLQDQPFPHLHTYTIGVDNTTISSSSCASALFRPRPHKRCINVACSGTNGIGWTFTSLRHCRTFDSKKDPIAGLRRGVLQQPSTTYALLVAVFFLSLLTCATVIMRRREVTVF
ncbi:uncharacterized protein [Diadema antillarum]|uniref:uncharacterized protein n=1 Tax=Diadema antillarum TaxID=105358 RepID=UPI003A83DDFE